MQDIQTSQQLAEHYKAQEALLRAKIAQTEWYMATTRARPSFYTPCTIRRDGGRWICILESSTNPLDCVMATGDSPEQAAANYDLLWWGRAQVLAHPEPVEDDEEEYEDEEQEYDEPDFF